MQDMSVTLVATFCTTVEQQEQDRTVVCMCVYGKYYKSQSAITHDNTYPASAMACTGMSLGIFDRTVSA